MELINIAPVPQRVTWRYPRENYTLSRADLDNVRVEILAGGKWMPFAASPMDGFYPWETTVRFFEQYSYLPVQLRVADANGIAVLNNN